MSRVKVLGLLEELGGHASTKALRLRAKQKYPKLSLHRTLHTTLKKLLGENVLSYLTVSNEWVRREHESMVAKYDPDPEIKKQAEQDMWNFERNIVKITEPTVDPIGDVKWPEGEDDPPKPKEKDSFKYRDKHEIAWSIVKAISDGKNRTTAIMYSSWLSHYQLTKYLSTLLDNGLIVKTGKNQFDVTPKGIEFMDAMKKVSQIKFD